jgi:hypothetical protein
VVGEELEGGYFEDRLTCLPVGDALVALHRYRDDAAGVGDDLLNENWRWMQSRSNSSLCAFPCEQGK